MLRLLIASRPTGSAFQNRQADFARLSTKVVQLAPQGGEQGTRQPYDLPKENRVEKSHLRFSAGCGRVQPHFVPLFFFFFLWVREAALPLTSQGISQGIWSPGPLMKNLYKESAPSSGTACSLELSLPSPAGIWFKTLLPVGGTNTAPAHAIMRG